ncbi:hypothetical protein ABS71_11785 [bacterium SCN 62-11]|nr:MAG: hypothetical protein ABS71_11785 [bacterium SCN 62-11]
MAAPRPDEAALIRAFEDSVMQSIGGHYIGGEGVRRLPAARPEARSLIRRLEDSVMQSMDDTTSAARA